MNDYDKMMLEVTELAERLVKLTPFAVGHLGGILVDANRIKAADLMLSIDVNLKESQK